MSVQYHREVFSDGYTSLAVNISGVKDGVVKASSFVMSIYAYDTRTAVPKFSAKLDIEQTRNLFDYLGQFSLVEDRSKTVSGKFIETTDEIVELLNGLKVISPEILKSVLMKLSEDEKVKAILESLTTLELKNLSAAYKQKNYQTELENLELLLGLEEKGNIVSEIIKFEKLASYVARQPEKIFQNWVEQNLWVFGIEYLQKYDARKIAIFSEGDLLMESADGFLDLIELKRPKLSYDIFKFDPSHKSYYPSEDLSKVIGQCLFYLQKMDDYKLNIEKEYKVKVLRPRIKIIAGRSNSFNPEQFEALRMLNCNLNHIQIISYDYLLSCGRKIISLYEQ